MFLHQKLKYKTEFIPIDDIKTAASKIADFLNYAKGKINFMGYDTETTGLSIIKDKPFLVVMGYKERDNGQGHAVVFEYNAKLMNAVFSWYQVCEYNIDNDFVGLFAHNAKYDYHMMQNGGSPIPFNKKLDNGKELKEIDVYDSITVARLTEYCDDEYLKLSLEALGERYVDENAKFAGNIIKDQIKKINKVKRDRLRKAIMENYPDDGYKTITKAGTVKGTGKLTRLLAEYDKRVAFIDDNNEIYNFISENYKPANYEDVYKKEPELMINYALDDVVLMLEYLTMAMNTLKNTDKDYKVLKREGKLIKAVADLEKVGIKADIDYILKCRDNLIKYKEELYFNLYMITDKEFTSGQHKEIMKILLIKYGIKTDKTDEKALKYIREHSDNEDVKEMCSIIMELRTIDKWLGTYVDGKLNSIIDGRIHTDINNNGAVSGRVSCNMQQQPKKALKTRSGEELFHPRRLFIPDEDFIMSFEDQSQMELRVLANYTVEFNEVPDKMLCRAYMPYNCYRYEESCDDRIIFNYKNTEDLSTFNQYTWYQNENDEEWHPTDLHSETTKNAFPDVPMDSKEFKEKRKLGKMTNFLIVYSGGIKALQDQLGVTYDLAETLIAGFTKAFPKVKDYQKYVDKHLKEYGYIENMYGRRYYMSDSRNFYKASNYLIQGTCADMLKDFEIKIWEYLKENNLKSKMILPIHDEIMLLIHKDEMFVINKVKEIMEDVKDVIKYVPMICDVEISNTNWAEKEDYNEI